MKKTAYIPLSDRDYLLIERLTLLGLLAEEHLNEEKEAEQRKHEPLFPEWKSFPWEN